MKIFSASEARSYSLELEKSVKRALEIERFEEKTILI